MSSERTRIVVVGTGGHSQVVADAIARMKDAGKPVELAGFLDERVELHGTQILGATVLGSIADLPDIPHDGVVVAIGDNATRQRVFEELVAAGEHLVSVIHPAAVIAPDVQIGVGCMIIGGVVINTGTVVGDNTILNTGCTVDHHNTIGSHVHIAPGAHLGGNVWAGHGAMVGIGASVLPRITIGEAASVGAGAVVLENVPDSVTVVGVPARAIGSPTN
jgi:sugar O-acyltransferase (sialic acid O-acetyltransferase NeuD family)